jgi:hypothetical protein
MSSTTPNAETNCAWQFTGRVDNLDGLTWRKECTRPGYVLGIFETDGEFPNVRCIGPVCISIPREMLLSMPGLKPDSRVKISLEVMEGGK